jgi:hypothetical protein
VPVPIHAHQIWTKRRGLLAASAAMAAAFAAAALGGVESPRAAGAGDPCEGSGKRAQIATAKLIIEYNATDNDIGVHGAFDDQGWSKLCVYSPDGRPLLTVSPEGQLRDLTMGGIFFESREPPAEEFSFEDLQARFAEGMYPVRALSFDGRLLTGRATFTHDVPAAPTVNAPKDGARVQADDVVEHDDPHGFSQPIYDVHVPPDRNALPVPKEFFEPGTEYELEVLALETSGNQTITVRSFTTE